MGRLIDGLVNDYIHMFTYVTKAALPPQKRRWRYKCFINTNEKRPFSDIKRTGPPEPDVAALKRNGPEPGDRSHYREITTVKSPAGPPARHFNLVIFETFFSIVDQICFKTIALTLETSP